MLEETGKAITGIVDGLKQQPLCLALVVMNVGLMLIIWLVINVSTSTRKHEMELLSRCERLAPPLQQLPKS